MARATATSRRVMAMAPAWMFGLLSIMPALVMLALVAMPASHAQPVSDRQLGQDQFKRVEQGRGDRGPLDGSLLAISRDLRVPNDFSGVYRISPEAPSRYAGRFARMSGGLVAVFPQSVYQVTRSGIRAPIPPGTEFFIGGVPRREVVPSAPSPLLVQTQAPTLRVDTSVSPTDATIEQPPPAAPPTPRASTPSAPPSTSSADATSDGLPRYVGLSSLGKPIPTEEFIRSTRRIMHDEVYRGRRLATLLQLALQQGQVAAPVPATPAAPVPSPR